MKPDISRYDEVVKNILDLSNRIISHKEEGDFESAIKDLHNLLLDIQQFYQLGDKLYIKFKPRY